MVNIDTEIRHLYDLNRDSLLQVCIELLKSVKNMSDELNNLKNYTKNNKKPIKRQLNKLLLI